MLQKNSPKFFSLQLGADDSYLDRIKKKLTRAAFYFKIKNLLYKINQHFKIFKNVFYSNNLHTALPFAKKLVPCVTRQIIKLKRWTVKIHTYSILTWFINIPPIISYLSCNPSVPSPRFTDLFTSNVSIFLPF